MIRTVPHDAEFYPTLGPQVCSFIEANLPYGPGDLRGQPVVLDDEKRGLIYRLYEVYPQGHPQAGRRRFQRAGISLAKGTGKTELAAWLAACELHPAAPVRCVGWTKKGAPIGGPVTDPYIPMVAYTGEQSDELAYGALRVMLEDGALRDDFDIGLERILRKRGDGKAVSLSSSPNARDGARTTFCVMDETHRWTLPRLKHAHQTMLANLPKRKLSDPWSLEITTAPEPGVGSVAESMMAYAEAVEAGRVTDAALFFFHRQASDDHDLTTRDGARAAVLEAAGASAAWRDVEAIVNLWTDPGTDRAYWERVFCNRLVRGATQAFNVEEWRALATTTSPVKSRDLITIGFDGAMFHDATAIVCTHVATGYQWTAGIWECPPGHDQWQVPAEEVDAVMRALFGSYSVWRAYCDPPYWQSWIAAWRGSFGEDKVIEWWTNRRRPMAMALEGFSTAIREGLISHDGHPDMVRHLANARRQDLHQRDEQGQPVWLIRKDRADSPAKIDCAMAAILSWEARTDAIAAGAGTRPAEPTLLILGGRATPNPWQPMGRR